MKRIFGKKKVEKKIQNGNEQADILTHQPDITIIWPQIFNNEPKFNNIGKGTDLMYKNKKNK